MQIQQAECQGLVEMPPVSTRGLQQVTAYKAAVREEPHKRSGNPEVTSYVFYTEQNQLLITDGCLSVFHDAFGNGWQFGLL